MFQGTTLEQPSRLGDIAAVNIARPSCYGPWRMLYYRSLSVRSSCTLESAGVRSMNLASSNSLDDFLVTSL